MGEMSGVIWVVNSYGEEGRRGGAKIKDQRSLLKLQSVPVLDGLAGILDALDPVLAPLALRRRRQQEAAWKITVGGVERGAARLRPFPNVAYR